MSLIFSIIIIENYLFLPDEEFKFIIFLTERSRVFGDDDVHTAQKWYRSGSFILYPRAPRGSTVYALTRYRYTPAAARLEINVFRPPVDFFFTFHRPTDLPHARASVFVSSRFHTHAQYTRVYYYIPDVPTRVYTKVLVPIILYIFIPSLWCTPDRILANGPTASTSCTICRYIMYIYI